MEIDPGDRMITDQEEVIMDYEEEVEMSAGTAEEDAMMDDEVGTGEGENDHDMDAEPTTTTAIPPEVIIDATVPIPSFFPSTAVPAITTTPPLANVGGLSSQPFPSPPAPETEMTPVNEEPPVGVSMTESKPDGLATPLTVEEGVGASSNPTAIPTIPPPAANSSALPTVSSSPALLPPVQQESLQVKAESSTMGGASDPSIDLNSGVSTDPSSSTATASSSLHGRPASDEDRAPASTNDENEEEEAEKVVEENDDQEEYFEDDEKTIDAHTLPPICLHLPGLGARALFSPLPKDEVDMNLPVWLKDRQEDLAGATLAEVWSAIREELRREKMDKSGEMVLVEKQMELRMGDDDKHLQTVTLLDFLQVHHDCALPLPVQLYLVFEPNRFIARFHAIKKEVEDRRESTASEEEPEYIYEDGETQADQTGNDEEGDEQEREEQADDEGEYDGDYPEEDDYAEGEAEAEAEVEVQPEEVSAEDEVQEEEQDQEEQEEVQAEEEEEEETEEEADPEPQEQLESEPRAAVDCKPLPSHLAEPETDMVTDRARYGGSDLAHERRQVDWARAHGGK
ncbi:hypothetical protein BCR39DRAFT_239821 [Naematelia encephala]|uniref:Uncharacterized protein n=1 Tax=Naematelia encephala TaxID=71784 RepID=A0A1Y2AXI2_9TREE|nr:hypothetical protein BCR39DRAFT_239821 [Naematelia encephala]